jgi:hypothetical protein
VNHGIQAYDFGISRLLKTSDPVLSRLLVSEYDTSKRPYRVSSADHLTISPSIIWFQGHVESGWRLTQILSGTKFVSLGAREGHYIYRCFTPASPCPLYLNELSTCFPFLLHQRRQRMVLNAELRGRGFLRNAGWAARKLRHT